MGAWGTGIFENDTALDFVVVLVSGNDLSPVQGITSQILSFVANQGYIDSDDACEMLVAGEVVALIGGYGSSDAPDNLVQWVRQKSLSLTTFPVDKVIQAVEAVLANSELRELWFEDGVSADAREWEATVRDLIDRLKKFSATDAKNGVPTMW